MRLTLSLFVLPATAVLLSACLTPSDMHRPREVGEFDLPAEVIVDGPGDTTVRAARSGAMYVDLYDVSDLVRPRVEFLPPGLANLPIESDDDLPGSGGEREARCFIEPDMLVYTVEQATGPEYWATTEGASIEASEAGFLIVRAHPAIHEQIASTLR